MKFYKYSLIAALALSGALSACSDDVEYSAAAPTPGVFFPVNANISKLTIEPVAGSFDIEVARYGYTEEQTYNFTNNFSENAGFTMPASVTFAAEEMEKTVTVSYDGTTMTPGVYNLKIGFAANQPVNAFGENELNIAVTLPEPVEVLPWNDLGECTYTDPFVSQGLYSGLPKLTYNVHIEESGDTPGLYRLVAPYGSAFAQAWFAGTGDELPADAYDSANELYLEIHAENPDRVYILPQLLGVTLDSDGMMMFMNLAGLRINNIMNNSEIPDENKEAEIAKLDEGYFGTLKDGVLTLPNRTSLVAFPYSTDTEVQGNAYYGNTNGAVKMIVMPGVVAGDYGAEAQYLGQFTNNNTGETLAIGTFSFGEDVVAAKAGIVWAATGTSVVQGITDGTYTGAVDIDLNDPTASFPVYAAGTHTIAVVTYNESGEVAESSEVTFSCQLYNDENAWNTLGEAAFADGWILGSFFRLQDGDIYDYAYPVVAQESKSKPGLYRFKDVWGPNSPIGGNNLTPDNSTDLYIDASDPEFIMIIPQFSGVTFSENGTVTVTNYEGYYFNSGNSKEAILSQIGQSTTLKDGIFTVDPPLFMISAAPGKLYGGKNPAMIQLPEPENAGDENADAQVTAKAVKASRLKEFKSKFVINRNAGLVSDKNNGRHQLVKANKANIQVIK